MNDGNRKAGPFCICEHLQFMREYVAFFRLAETRPVSLPSPSHRVDRSYEPDCDCCRKGLRLVIIKLNLRLAAAIVSGSEIIA